MKLIVSFCFLVFGLNVFGQNDTAYSKVFGTERDENICRVERYKSGFIAVGTVQTQTKETDIFIELIDSNFTPIEKIEIGTPYIETANDFFIDIDGNIFICGQTNAWGKGSYDAYLIMVDSSLSLKWEHTFGSEGWDFSIGLAKGINGQNFICIEKNEVDGKRIIDFVAFYENGTTDLIFSDTISNNINLNCFLTDNAYNFIVGGNCIDSSGFENAFVASYSASNSINWQTCLMESEDQSINHLILENNHFFGVGYTYELGNGNKEYYMVEIDLNGNLIKKSIPNYYPNDDEEAFFIAKTAKGFGIIAGTKSIGESPGKNDFQFIEVTASGTLIDGYNYGWREIDTPTNFIIDSTGFLLIGNTNSIGHGYGDYVIIDVNEAYSKPHLVFDKVNSSFAQSITNIDEIKTMGENQEILGVKVYDVTGRLILSNKKTPDFRLLPKNQVLIVVWELKSSSTINKIIVEN